MVARSGFFFDIYLSFSKSYLRSSDLLISLLMALMGVASHFKRVDYRKVELSPIFLLDKSTTNWAKNEPLVKRVKRVKRKTIL